MRYALKDHRDGTKRGAGCRMQDVQLSSMGKVRTASVANRLCAQVKCSCILYQIISERATSAFGALCS